MTSQPTAGTNAGTDPGTGGSLLDRARRLLPAGRRDERRRGSARRGSRGSAELSVVVVAASLVAGLAFGEGLSRTVVDITDGLTWISDDPTGEVIQVNPATGRPEKRLAVGAPGEDLDVSQADGRLFVTNRTTGEVFSIDLASVLVSGQRRVATGNASDLLLHDGAAFLVDRANGTVSRIDPSTTDAIGERWVATEGLADATIDGEGIVWVIDTTGRLSQLRWSDGERRFVTEDSRQVEYAGEGSVLVAHPAGVTVFGPDAGIVVQVGTGSDVVADAPALNGTLLAPDDAPADLSPVAAPQTGSLVIVGSGELREVDLRGIGCGKPGRPAVHRSLVYVPCDGDGRIVVLDRTGQRAARDIPVPGDRDAELVVDDGNLVVNVPGAQAGLVVRADGRIDDLTRYDERVAPTRLSSTRPPATATGARAAADRDRRPPVAVTPPVVPPVSPPDAPVAPPTGRPSGSPPDGPASPPTNLPTNLPDDQPPGNQPPGAPTGTPGLPGGPGTGPGTGGPGATPGTPGGPGTPPATGPTTPPTAPPTSPPTDPPAAALQAPTGVTGTVVADGVVEVRWAHAGPAATAFDVSVVDNGALFASVDGSERTARLTVPLGQPVRFVVTAVGDGARQASAPSAPVTASSRPGAPAAVGGSVATGAHDAGAVTATVTWGEAEAYGSPVTGYTVVLSSGGAGGATQTQRVGADARTATFTVPCTDTGGEQCDPGTTSVSVHATNAEGDGPAATATIGEGGAGAARLPGAGRQHVTGHTGGDITYEGFGEVTLSLAPPADWAAFTGTCSYTTDAGSFTLPCGETSLTIQYNEEIAYVECGRPGGVGGGQQPLTRQRQVVFTADNGRTSAQSATYTFTTEQATWCRGTPLP